ncbi:MAG: MBL fold metallo-hydrolase [Myxococcota bacterium]|nr:MBL fold metallo-hydrolase [Myxococcota bacterium]
MRALVVALALFLGLPASSEEPLRLEQLLEMFGYDLSATEIRTEKVADGLYVLFGAGGNIGVSVGSDGVLVVDDQFPELIPKVRAAIEAIGGGPIDYAINTHWHFDHAQGNLALGPAGTTLVSHANARRDMATGGIVNLVIARYRQEPYPPGALPSVTTRAACSSTGTGSGSTSCTRAPPTPPATPPSSSADAGPCTWATSSTTPATRSSTSAAAAASTA